MSFRLPELALFAAGTALVLLTAGTNLGSAQASSSMSAPIAGPAMAASASNAADAMARTFVQSWSQDPSTVRGPFLVDLTDPAAAGQVTTPGVFTTPINVRIQNLGDTDVTISLTGGGSALTVPAGTGTIARLPFQSSSSLEFQGNGSGTRLLFVVGIN